MKEPAPPPRPEGSRPARRRTEPMVIPEKYPLMAVAALVLLSLGVVTFARLTDVGVQGAPGSATEYVEVRRLFFEDTGNGDVVVVDADTGADVWTYGAAEGGFARTALRGMAYTRSLKGVGPEEPFLLKRDAKGSLVLEDPVTGRRIGLDAFGGGNSGQFAVILGEEENQ